LTGRGTSLDTLARRPDLVRRTIRAEIEKRLGLWVALGAAVLVAGFYIASRFI